LPDALSSPFNKVIPLPSIPNSVNMGNVADLLKRRPDIAIAENNLKAAIADYNVSIADQFPQVHLMGTLGFAATSLSSFGASAVVASIGPNVSWSAFDMGRVKARINQNDARAQAAIARYDKTVLEALEELQTSVSNFSMQEQRRGSLQSATRSAKEAANLALSLYQAGIYTFIDALSAEATLFEAEDTLAQSEITTALELIAVYKALGGGWEFKG
jgi:multidrug efflux system outer membrane protein